MSRSFHTVTLRALAAMLLLCALAVRMAVPQGYMWSAGTDGAPEMLFCQGAATLPAVTPLAVLPLAVTALAAQRESDRRDRPGKAADHPCAFAVAGAAVDLAARVHPAAAAVAATNDAPAFSRQAARPGLGLAAPPPPKTGPPAFV